MEENVAQYQSTEVQNQQEKRWLKIALFSVSGLVLAGGLVFAGVQIGRRQTRLFPQPVIIPPKIAIPTLQVVVTPTSQPETSPFPDETAGWKSYTNRKCGYEVKYPSDWKLIPEAEDAMYGAAVIFPYEVGSGVKPPADWLKVQIGCAKIETSVNPKDIVDQLNRRDTGYGVSKIEGLEQVNLNGNLAFRQINIPPVGDSVLEYYIFPAGDKYYNLGFTPADTGLKATIGLMLSTFRFLPSASSGQGE